MRIARLISPTGDTVLARIENGVAEPLAFQLDHPRSDVLIDLLDRDVDITRLTAVAAPFSVADAEWCAPVTWPSKIIAVGLNYADHAREANLDLPTAPMIFAKYPNSLAAHGDPIVYRTSNSIQVDYESELAIIIGRRTFEVGIDTALDSVLGYTICNDVSARDAQFADKQFTRAKSFNTFCPLGPTLVTADEIADPQRLRIASRVNGVTVQDSTTAEMIFSIAELISYLSRVMTLEVGDVITTGTPAGVGMAKVPPLYLVDGDVVEVEIEGLGILSNPVQQL